MTDYSFWIPKSTLPAFLNFHLRDPSASVCLSVCNDASFGGQVQPLPLVHTVPGILSILSS